MTRLTRCFVACCLLCSSCSDPECRPGEIKVGMTCYSAASTRVDASTEIASAAVRDASTSDAMLSEHDLDADIGSVASDDAAPSAAAPEAALPSTSVDASACQSATEICDEKDNDCDGAIDEGVSNDCGGCEVLTHSVGESCNNGALGVCLQAGEYRCTDAKLVCGVTEVVPTSETCDLLDNNCDGVVDEQVKNACQGCATLVNDKGSECTNGVGACAAKGTYDCTGVDSTVCNAVPKSPISDFGFATGGVADLNCNGTVEYETTARNVAKQGETYTFPRCGTTVISMIEAGLTACPQVASCYYQKERKCSSSASDFVAIVLYLNNPSATCSALQSTAWQYCR